MFCRRSYDVKLHIIPGDDSDTPLFSISDQQLDDDRYSGIYDAYIDDDPTYVDDNNKHNKSEDTKEIVIHVDRETVMEPEPDR